MAEKKLSQLPTANSAAADDRLVILANTSTTPVARTITTANFANSVAARLISNATPVANTSNGSPGQIAYDSSHIYVCVANNTWGRAALTFSW
jgi:hypothetical protein